MKQITLGILAHVDAGKTTLSEAMLYTAGNIRAMGRVDHQNAHLDTHSLEKKRGITIFSKQAMLGLPKSRINLLDTPGHMDFSAEMERTLQVLDYGILVVSAIAGVQSHTETLCALLAKYNIPTFVFVNKTDLPHGEKEELFGQIQKVLGGNCVDFSDFEARDEAIALCDEDLMEQYLETGELSQEGIQKAIAQRKLFPCVFGSALKLEGVTDLLTTMDDLMVEPDYGKKFGARVYKISFDQQGTRLTHLKITGGGLKVKGVVFGTDRDGNQWSEKVNQIRIYSGAKFDSIDEARAGTVCAVTGLTSSIIGDGYGVEQGNVAPMIEPVLTYRVALPIDVDATTALGYFKIVEQEDPQLHIHWNSNLGEIYVQMMGVIQIEILQTILEERFGLLAQFDCGNIVYKETISNGVNCAGHFEPLKHYAEVHLKLEPLPRGSGIILDTVCPRDELAENYQNLVFTHLQEIAHRGSLTNSAITDLKITLTHGRAHIKHTEGGDFREATYRALRQGLMKAEKILLEPYYAYRLEVPSENIGRALNDVGLMHGTYQPPETQGDYSVLKGTVPVSTSRDYQRDLMHYTKGKGKLSLSLHGYDTCQDWETAVREIGYDPERDSVDTGNSVFCDRGAGFTVHWSESDEMMHIKPEKEKKKVEEPTFFRPKSNITGTDEELLAIFERTYGKINRDPRIGFQKTKKTTVQPTGKYRGDPIPRGPEYVLVDGYNIIFAWDDLKALAGDSLNAARMKLMDILVNYAAYRQCNLILVFDAYKVKNNPGVVEDYHNIKVVYTKEAETADMYIEKTSQKMSKSNKVSVATSDNLEQMIIWGHGALRVSAQEFREQIHRAEVEMREILKNL
ncbi:MAG: translation factor GTPase family protein [Eubacteriales bacterium]